MERSGGDCCSPLVQRNEAHSSIRKAKKTHTKQPTTTAGCQTTTWHPQDPPEYNPCGWNRNAETRAAAHETLTRDHRACKKHVSFNLGWTRISLLKQTTAHTPAGVINHSRAWRAPRPRPRPWKNPWWTGDGALAQQTASLSARFGGPAFHHLERYLTGAGLESARVLHSLNNTVLFYMSFKTCNTVQRKSLLQRRKKIMWGFVPCRACVREIMRFKYVNKYTFMPSFLNKWIS